MVVGGGVLMFLYGHMLREHDRMDWTINGVVHRVEILDIWESKMLHSFKDGRLEGARWIELWTIATDSQIARPVAIVYTTDFSPWYGIDRPFTGSALWVGTSKRQYASNIGTTHSYREWISSQ